MSTAHAGQPLTLTAHGYNTNWSIESGQIRSWLKYSDSLVIEAHQVHVVGNTELTSQFRIPSAIPDGKEAMSVSLIVDHPTDGPAVLPNALIIKRGKKSDASIPWPGDAIVDLNFKKRFAFPYRNIIFETIRNTYFHVPLWMAMYGLLVLATIYNILYLWKGDMWKEERAFHLTSVALVYGTLGIATGMMWAEFAWGTFWNWDIKQTMSLLAMLMFVAYVFIRFSIADESARRRFNAVYGIFAFIMIFPLLYVVPRMAPSLHPGSGGNPAFGSDDMDNTMRMVFYPAIIAYFLLGLWLAQLSYRLSRIKQILLFKN